MLDCVLTDCSYNEVIYCVCRHRWLSRLTLHDINELLLLVSFLSLNLRFLRFLRSCLTATTQLAIVEKCFSRARLLQLKPTLTISRNSNFYRLLAAGYNSTPACLPPISRLSSIVLCFSFLSSAHPPARLVGFLSVMH